MIMTASAANDTLSFLSGSEIIEVEKAVSHPIHTKIVRDCIVSERVDIHLPLHN